MAAKNPAIHVELVDHHVLQVLEQPEPPGVVRQDAGMEHVRVRHHDMTGVADCLPRRLRRIAIVRVCLDVDSQRIHHAEAARSPGPAKAPWSEIGTTPVPSRPLAPRSKRARCSTSSYRMRWASRPRRFPRAAPLPLRCAGASTAGICHGSRRPGRAEDRRSGENPCTRPQRREVAGTLRYWRLCPDRGAIARRPDRRSSAGRPSSSVRLRVPSYLAACGLSSPAGQLDLAGQRMKVFAEAPRQQRHPDIQAVLRLPEICGASI